MGRVSRVKCASNMRSLHVSFSSYIQDHDMWPPAPPNEDAAMDQSEKWWLKIMSPYVDTPKVWLCPILEKSKLTSPSGAILQMHYIPTQFDGTKMGPFRWPKQPWLVEMANAHNDGALILFPDGSVRSLKQVLQGR